MHWMWYQKPLHYRKRNPLPHFHWAFDKDWSGTSYNWSTLGHNQLENRILVALLHKRILDIAEEVEEVVGGADVDSAEQ